MRMTKAICKKVIYVHKAVKAPSRGNGLGSSSLALEGNVLSPCEGILLGKFCFL